MPGHDQIEEDDVGLLRACALESFLAARRLASRRRPAPAGTAAPCTAPLLRRRWPVRARPDASRACRPFSVSIRTRRSIGLTRYASAPSASAFLLVASALTMTTGTFRRPLVPLQSDQETPRLPAPPSTRSRMMATGSHRLERRRRLARPSRPDRSETERCAGSSRRSSCVVGRVLDDEQRQLRRIRRPIDRRLAASPRRCTRDRQRQRERRSDSGLARRPSACRRAARRGGATAEARGRCRAPDAAAGARAGVNSSKIRS